ncbi:MAG TPA: ABC transporter permease [Terriglobales bacterium]|nr:ABC transporter permease [Terriglobales bacterium]
MNLLETIRQTISAMRAHKLRSFLTMFGIIWGIASVIILVGLGKGFNTDQKKRMHTIGIDLMVVWGGRTSAQAGGYAAGRPIRLNINDAYRLKEEAYLFKTVSPELMRPVSQVSQYNAASRPVRGVWPEYQRFRSLSVSQGRLMSEQDERLARRVVVLGVEAAQQLFPGKPAIGSTIQMAGYPYEVIGVLSKKKQNGSYGMGPDNTQLFVPYSAMARDFPPKERPWHVAGYINTLVLEVADPEQHDAAKAQLYRILGSAHHFEPDDEDAIWVWDTLKGAKLNQRIFNVMTMFFGAVALMTLSLGGIGVMNIMLVSVTERTREIGVRKALGATYGDIKRQFFTESAVLTLISGLVGFTVGVGICFVMQNVTLPDFIPAPEISPAAIAASIITLGLITMTAGMYPASRAANKEPVECLRYE